MRTPVCNLKADLLNDALTSDHAGYIANALGVIARARGMVEMARRAGITREAVYKSLSEAGDPKLSTLLGVTRALASHYPPVPPPGTDPPWP